MRLDHDPHRRNMGWKMVLVADACDCFDLPDGKDGTIAALDIQAAHVATLAVEFCKVMTTADAIDQARTA